VQVPRPGRTVIAELPKLDNLDVAGKRVLVRADLNVPLDGGVITDDFRINAFLPTLERILERGGTAVVCSHLGRPSGPDAKYTLAPVASALSEALAGDVPLVFDYAKPPQVRVALLENLRFNEGETRNDPAFVDTLVSIADAYVNDAFGSCHRAHASIVGPPATLPSSAGLLLEREVANLGKLLGEPDRPYVVVLGGSKVSDKIGVVRNLLSKADRILIGGGMCFTFLKALGVGVGKSLVDDERFDEVKKIASSDKLLVPSDFVVGNSPDAAGGKEADSVSDEMMGLDIGPASAAAFAKEISGAKTVFWNGPMGVFENDAFANGTKVIAQAVADCEGYTVTGGGDTAAALSTFGLEGSVDFASTGGGASLEFLEGKSLPGIAALTKGGSGGGGSRAH
jgi:phosphoglycerate kinase